MTIAECIFCKIVKGIIPANKIFENDKIVAFKDLHPQSKVHLLFIHKSHTDNVNQIMLDNSDHLSDIFRPITEMTQKDGLDKTGFRVVTNLGPHAGQTVFHTHFHVLAGEPLGGFGAR